MGSEDFKVIIQRFNVGDRSLEVLAPLNEAAWNGFHDPWERKPFFLTEGAEVFLGGGLPNGPGPSGDTEAPEQGAPGSPRNMEAGRSRSALPPRLAEQIAGHLDVLHWNPVQGENGGFRCTPATCGMAGQDLTLRISGGGPRSRFLWFHLTSGFPVPDDARSIARALCTRWNHTHLTFCASLETQNPFQDRREPRTGTLSLYGAMPIPPEVTMRTIAAFLDQCMDQAGEFWMQARAGLLP